MGVYLSTPIKDKLSETGSNAYSSYAVSSMQGWRSTMEDTHIANGKLEMDGNCALYCVFDGHGGKNVSEYARDHFEKVLLKNENFLKGEIKTGLEQSFLEIDGDMRSKSDDTDLNGGCTANVVVIHNNTIYCANSGDSRAIIYQDDNKITALSRDHKPDEQSELDRITAAGGFVTNGRVNGNLNLTRAFGDFEYKRNEAISAEQQMITAFPEIKVFEKTDKDRYLLLGCDGIYEKFSNEEIFEKIKRLDKGGDLKNTVENLLEELIAPDTSTGMGCDNMTCILVKFNEAS